MKAASPPRRILVIRLSALGDVVMASGLITALHARFPGAEVSWLCEPPCVPLLAHNPRLARVIVWPKLQWKQLWKEKRWGELRRAFAAFRRELRAQRFDLVLDAQGLLKSGLCAWLTGAPRRISLFAREGSRVLFHERLVPPADPTKRISSEYRYLATFLGAAESDFQLDLAVGETQRTTARRVLAEAGVQGRFAALCPFTTRPQKHWFEDDWVGLAQALSQRGLVPVMFGGPADAQAAARMAARCGAIVDLAGRLKLDETVAALADAALLVGVDTGLTHMGTALRLPTVALFGSTRPYLRSDSPRTVVLYEPLPCSPCRRHPTCGGRFDCMRAHTVQGVLAAADRAMQVQAPATTIPIHRA